MWKPAKTSKVKPGLELALPVEQSWNSGFELYSWIDRQSLTQSYSNFMGRRAFNRMSDGMVSTGGWKYSDNWRPKSCPNISNAVRIFPTLSQYFQLAKLNFHPYLFIWAHSFRVPKVFWVPFQALSESYITRLINRNTGVLTLIFRRFIY